VRVRVYLLITSLAELHCGRPAYDSLIELDYGAFEYLPTGWPVLTLMAAKFCEDAKHLTDSRVVGKLTWSHDTKDEDVGFGKHVGCGRLRV